LRCDLPGRGQQLGEVVDGSGELSAATAGHRVVLAAGTHRPGLRTCPSQRSLGVGQQPFGVPGGGLGQVGQLAVEPAHRGPRFILLGSGTHPQPRADLMRPPAGCPGPVPHLGAGRATGGLDPPTGDRDPADRLGQQTRVGRIGNVAGHHRGVGPQLAVRSSLACAALTNSASFKPSTAAEPQRVVSFINVVGCGTDPSNGIRQNRRHVIESDTSRHSVS
jgi:hypothetical protein